MRPQKNFVGEFEEFVLLAIRKLDDNAYGVTIRQTLEKALGRTISIGATYTTLERLEEKGFISSWAGEPTAERGGRAKRYFRLEGPGERVLREMQLARHNLTTGFETVCN
jgi:PadR family transcriptional regulator, regulatory protein PadR